MIIFCQPKRSRARIRTSEYGTKPTASSQLNGKAPGEKDGLGLFQSRELLDQLLLAEPGKTDSKFRIVAGSFASQNQSAAVFRMSDMGSWRKYCIRNRGRLRRFRGCRNVLNSSCRIFRCRSRRV